MARKSFSLGYGMIATASLPFFAGASGTDHVPDGPCVVAANHSSFLDGPLLALAYAKAKLVPLHMIAYEEPFHHWLMGWILRSGGNIPFRRGDRRSQAAMMARALGWLGAGEAVGIFPEGHINRRRELGRPRPGAALLALEAGCPVVPAAIVGSAETLPPGASFPRPGRRIRVVFGSPLGPFAESGDYASAGRDARRAMIRDVSSRVMREIGRLSGRSAI